MEHLLLKIDSVVPQYEELPPEVSLKQKPEGRKEVGVKIRVMGRDEQEQNSKEKTDKEKEDDKEA